jgi:hypothetical protein
MEHALSLSPYLYWLLPLDPIGTACRPARKFSCSRACGHRAVICRDILSPSDACDASDPTSSRRWAALAGSRAKPAKWSRTGKIGGGRDAKPETKKGSNCALNPNNKGGLDSSQVESVRPGCVGPAVPAAAGTGANRRGAHGTAHGAAAAARPRRGLSKGTWLPRGTWSWGI